MRLHRTLALALYMAGCGPGPAPARPGLPAGRVVHYQPLELQRDARQPGQAVILGTDDSGGSTVLPIPVAATVVVVHATPASATGELPAIVLTSAPRSPVVGPAAGGSTTAGATAAAPTVGNSTAAGSTAGPPAGSTTAGPTVGNSTAASPATAGSTTGSPAAAGPVAAVQVGSAGETGAAAARWRWDVWSAARVAAGALGKSLDDVALEATPAGPVDATASALIAGGLVAALIGDTIDPAATLAGAIEPDGTIGPVAGLPEQVAAALAHGMRRIGYPAGMRIARSAVSGKDVDIVELARSHGAEAVELAGVHDAYQLLTGHRLPAPVPVAAAAMALDPATLDRLAARYAAWQDRLAGEWAPLLQLEQAGRQPSAVAAMVRAAHAHSERAAVLRRAGKPAAAPDELRAAWLAAAAANQAHAVIARLAGGDVDGAATALAALDAGDAHLRALFGKIGDARPTTLAGHLALLEALEAALRAWTDRELAGDALHTAAQLIGELRGRPAAELGAPALAEAVSAAVAPAVERALAATAELAIAEQALEPLSAGASAPSVACSASPASLARAAAALDGAAAAGLGHADALVVEPLAQNAGLTVDAARRRAAAHEPDYRIAELSRTAPAGLPHELAAAWGDGSLAAALLALATARSAHAAAARLIAQHEALGVHRNGAARGATGTAPAAGAAPAAHAATLAIDHPQALRPMLASAERTARAAAHAAQVATGAIPVQTRLAYQRAAIASAGGPAEQLDALAALWVATAASETAVMLARNCN